MHGFQLWLNLPAAEKMKPAAYRDIPSAEIASYKDAHGSELRVIAGEIGIDGTRISGSLPAMATRPLLADLSVAPGADIVLEIAEYEQVLVFVYAGVNSEIDTSGLGVYGKGDQLTLRAGAQGFEALVLSGKALREPIAQHGPFVMNQPEEIEQAIRDFQQGTLVAPASG